MKLHLLDRSNLENRSFNLVHNRYPSFMKLWHYHPELELVYIVESTGACFVGDSIKKFEAGSLVLIGKNVPHMWLNDEAYFEEDSGLMAEAFGVHFTEEFLGEGFVLAPEMKPIQQLFQRARRGVFFLEPDPSILAAIRALFDMKPFEKTMQLIHILYDLAHHKHFALLASPGFMQSFNQTENRILDDVYAFVLKNFRKPIGSRDAAEVACMHPSAFSRFFKRTHRKTFTRYLNEVRVGYACKLLLEERLSVTRICYESGFSNVSNFNRQFKKIMKMSPTEYVVHHGIG